MPRGGREGGTKPEKKSFQAFWRGLYRYMPVKVGYSIELQDLILIY